MKKEIKVVPIENGTVIDHITAGQALNVLKVLDIKPSTKEKIAVVMNVISKKFGEKDLIMVGGMKISSAKTDRIALISPQATINIIESGVRVAKDKVKMPKIIEGIIRCANSNCISNAENEPVISEFITVRENPPWFRCLYCGRIIEDVTDCIR